MTPGRGSDRSRTKPDERVATPGLASGTFVPSGEDQLDYLG